MAYITESQLIDTANQFFSGLYPKVINKFTVHNPNNIQFNRLGIICIHGTFLHNNLKLAVTITRDNVDKQINCIIAITGNKSGKFDSFVSAQYTDTLFDAYHATMYYAYPYMRKNPD